MRTLLTHGLGCDWNSGRHCKKHDGERDPYDRECVDNEAELALLSEGS